MGVLASTLPIDQKGTPALYSDTLANRPSAGFTGRLFVSTDTFALYRDNGTTWDLIGGPGTGTITGTIQDTQVAFGTAANEIGGNANFIYNATTGQLSISNSNALNPTLLLKQSNANGELIIGRDAGDNDVFTVDQFGTIYAAAIQTFLDFANVYAGEFRNDNANGFGVTVRGGSATNNALVVSDATGAIDMLQVFSDRTLLNTPILITGSSLVDDYPTLTLRSNEVGGNLIFGKNENGDNFFIVTNRGVVYCDQIFCGVDKPNSYAAFFANTGVTDNGNGVQIQTDGLVSVNALRILGEFSTERFAIKGNGDIVSSGAINNSINLNTVYAAEFINTNATGKGLKIQAGSATTESLLIEDYLGVDLLSLKNNLLQSNVRLYVDNLIVGKGGLFALNNFVVDSINGGLTIQTVFNDVLINAVTVNHLQNILVNTTVDNGNKVRVNGTIYCDDTIFSSDGTIQSILSYSTVQSLGSVGTNTNHDFEIRANGTGALRFDKTTLNGTFSGAIKTDDPTGGTAQFIKLGSVVAAAVAFDAANYVEVEINGVAYKLALAN